MNRRVIPGDELAIMPDMFRLLDRHANSFSEVTYKVMSNEG
jgi:hypothetical protein